MKCRYCDNSTEPDDDLCANCRHDAALLTLAIALVDTHPPTHQRAEIREDTPHE